jgi:nitrate reductase delta subunit
MMNETARELAAGTSTPPDVAGQPPRKKAGPLRIGAFKTDALHRSAIEHVQQWTRTRYSLSEDAPVLVSELECKRPDCPPLETVVAFWTDDESRYHFKVFKPVTEVRVDDLPPTWLRDALFGTDDDGMGCC